MRCIKYFAGASLLFLCIFTLLTHPHPAHAEDAFNIVTSPLPINLHATPGTTVTADIKVKNGGTKTENLKVTLMKFSAYGEEGKPSVQDRGKGDDYFDWVSFSPSTFDAAPNEWVTVKMTITLPKTAAFGYYYAAAFSKASKPVVADTKQNVLVGSTAVLVLVDVQVPGANRTANIASFTADKSFYEFLPSTFTVKVHNSGNVHLIPTGNIFISRGGKNVATLEVNGPSGNVLPNSNRIFTATWSDGFPVYTTKTVNGKVVLDKNDKPVTSLSWDFSKASHLKFGHYTAHLVMAYDNGSRDVPLEATVSFWVVPVRLVFFAIAVPVIPSAFVYWNTKRRFKKRLARATAEAKKS